MKNPNEYQKSQHAMTVSRKQFKAESKTSKAKEQAKIDQLTKEFSGRVEIVPNKLQPSMRWNMKHLN